MMDIYDKLQKTKPYYGGGYIGLKDLFKTLFHEMYEALDKNRSNKIIASVMACLCVDFEGVMEKNDIDKLCLTVIGLIYEMDNNEVDPDFAYSTAYDIRDFDTGEYDDLFEPKDLEALKADVERCREYLKKHPEITDDLSEHFARADTRN